MKKILDAIVRDFWIVLLDIIAVNASYFLALLIRFYVNFQLRPVAMEYYLPAFVKFAPWYTVACIIIFMAWRLYGGLWRYAGINDMNRIILANLCTAFVQVVGSIAFFARMPITYYIIGALLQFAFVVTIRFSYRVLMVEKRKIRSRGTQKADCIIIGTGENGRRVLKNLEDSDAYRPIAIVGSGTGTMDGVSVVDFESVDWKNIGAVFIADPLLSFEKRQEIKEKAKETGTELHDYTGYFSNLGGRLSVTEFLSLIHSPITIRIEGKDTEYEDGFAALAALTEKYEVKAIDAEKIRVTLGQKKKMSTQEALAQAYAAVMGGESPQ